MQLNTAVGLVRRGCLRDAEQRVEESVALFRELGEGGGLGPAAVLLTWLHLVLGDGDAGVALLDGVSHDAYHGSPAVSTPALEVRALALWSTDRQSGMDLLRRGLTIDSARDIPAPARPWLTLARMAARCSDVGALEAVEAALPELNLETPEEVLYPRWTGALNARDAAAGSRELESLAQDLEALASVVDAADAYADGAVLAARAGIRSQERRLRSERDRLLAAAGGRRLLE